MIVADTNLIVYLLVDGEHTEQARRALQKDPEWSAPLLWISEVRHVLSTYLNQEIIEPETAHVMIGKAEELMAGNEYSVPSTPVLQRAAESGCAAYDCEFVVLAERLNAPMVTADTDLVSAFPDQTIPLNEFASN